MKRLLRDEVVLTVTGLLVLFFIFSTCTAMTGYTMANRSHRIPTRSLHWVRATDAEMRDVWQLPIILTIVWTPIVVWRAWRLRREP